MSSKTRNLAIAITALAAILIGAFALLQPRTVDEPLPHEETEGTPPAALPAGWAELRPHQTARLEATASSLRLFLDDDDGHLLSIAAPEGAQWSWSETQRTSGWKALRGEATGDGWELRLIFWSADNMPFFVIDLNGSVSEAALSRDLALTTELSGHTSSRFPASGPVQQVGTTTEISVALATTAGVIGAVTEDDDSLRISWSLWEGLPGAATCPNSAEIKQPITARLYGSLGHDLPVAQPLPETIRGLGTAIFFDPPRQNEEPWEDGRARTSEEFARRLRALAFGHSDPTDPRYGNGGLLAAGIGATFAIPAPWWDDEAITDLGTSLMETEIDLIAFVSPGDPVPQAMVATTEVSCDELDRTLGLPGGVLVRHRMDDHRPAVQHQQAPLHRFIEAGQAPQDRETLLDQIFEPLISSRLFAEGEHRTLFVPLTATRNPLVDSAENALLSADRGGHWTLHDSLTRRLGSWEFSPRRSSHKGISLSRMLELRQEASLVLPLPTPEGYLLESPDGDRPLHWHWSDKGPETTLAPLQILFP